MRSKMNNKGFSLVEILTTLAIGSVILLGVTAFMNGGSTTYRTVTTQVALQDDVQETVNYLTDLLQRSMDVYYNSTEKILYIFMPKKDTETEEFEVYYVIFDDANDTVYVHSEGVGNHNYNEFIQLTASEISSYSIKQNILADELRSFHVDIERDATTDEVSIVHVNVGFFKNNRHRDSTISIRPRNRSWTYVPTDPSKPMFHELFTGP